MTAAGNAQRSWSEADDATLRMLYKNVIAREIGEILGRTRSAIKNRARTIGISKPGENNGSFRSGMTPWNKGTHYVSGGRSVETRFKKGMQSRNHKPVGSTRVSVDGYIEIKIAEPRKWGQLHREVWKKHYGSYPHSDMAVAFRDGNKLNCDLSNLELISRRDLMLRNSCHNHGPEIAQIVQLQSAITRQINNHLRKSA